MLLYCQLWCGQACGLRQLVRTINNQSAAKARLCNQTSVKNHIQLCFFNYPDTSIIVEKEDNFQLLFEPNDIVLSIGEEVTVLSINLFRGHLSLKNMKCKNLNDLVVSQRIKREPQ